MAKSKGPSIQRQLIAIRRHIKAGRCAKALKLYRRLPESVRYRDSLGPLKAALNSCHRRR